MYPVELQQTIAKPVSVAGFGYWSGRDVRVEFRPAPPNSGVTFIRSDVGCDARVPVRADLRIDVPRRTNLRRGNVQVDMVEHILAALVGLNVDNCDVYVDQPEMPGCDGSAQAFVHAIDRAGVVRQGADVEYLEVVEPVRVSDGDCWIEARPSELGRLTIEYQLDYAGNDAIGRQSAKFDVTPQTFREEIAGCRTFLTSSEAKRLVEQGLGRRVTTRDLLVFGDDGPVDNSLRFDNECARHKVLDVLGDLALTQCRVIGKLNAFRSGHRLHAELARELVQRFGSSLASELNLKATA
jgi:UDP-3-O-acyl N-acetylglucosamine deacetylase